ncbi:hypothetical protein [Halobacteriovorax sp. HLS]|uniref:hypothetical protein n=1 Tax=Halobacteriovorax sp. HLS TaxID=2234000 RepID=UPI000FD959FE|nr:hypothetical protein [Halobacteriovorax sp. HLS]
MEYLRLSLLLFFSSTIFAQPKWINSPVDFCPTTELCAVGEATGAMGSEIAARNSLAKIFETRVSSEQTITTISSSLSDADGPINALVEEEFTQKVREFTDEVIQGAYIKERFESSDLHYSLVALPIMKASSIMEDKMRSMDELILSYIKDGRRNSLNKALKLFRIRENLNIRYKVLRNTSFNNVVSLDRIMSLKAKKRSLAVSVKVNIKEISKAGDLKKSVIKSLIDNDYLVSNKSPKFIINVSLESEQQFMKVEGFVKYKHILQASSTDSLGNKVGALKYETIQTGRSKQQAYDNALPGLTKFIHEKFDELNID